jgi:hypothetical protein
MINITKIYLVENCYGDSNKVYIGKTKNNRKSSHKNTFGNQIIYTYIDEIESTNREDWKPLESYWIEQFRQWGFEVMNKNKGGNGPNYLNKNSCTLISLNRTNKGLKPVIQYQPWWKDTDKDKIYIKEWSSAKEASLHLNIVKSNITACCKKKIKRAGGFIWEYK